jgi:hypothetical protein
MKKQLLILGMIVIAGCATPYQPQGLTGGFTEIQLEKNVFRISVRGNGLTSLERAGEMALVRSAEITLNNGFTHFSIVDEKADYHTFLNPFEPQTTIDSTTNAKVNAGGNSATGQVTSTTAVGKSTGKKPLNTSTIVCFNGKPDIKFYVYDAKLIFNSMAQRYGIK